MSALRGRTRDSSWQWLIIGVVLGFGCSGVLCLGLYAFHVIQIGSLTTDIAAAPTNQPFIQVVTATSLSGVPTLAATTAPTQADNTVNATGTPADNGAPTLTPYSVLPTTESPPGFINPTATLNATIISANLAATAAPTGAANSAAISPATAASGASSASGSKLPPDIKATTLIPLAGGTFEMGTSTKEAQQAVDDCTTRDKGKCELSNTQDSLPPHNVTVNGFSLEKTEVTYDQYVAFLNYLGPSSHLNGCGQLPCAAITDAEHQGSYIKFSGGKYSVGSELYRNRPVAFVTWYGADAFCKAIGRRLPTEAEWERAARSPLSPFDKRIYPWGNDWDPNNPKARTNRPKNQGGPDEISANKGDVSVDGIYDLAGNVSEWVFDWYEPYSRQTISSIDPKGPSASSVGHKVVRGGDWDSVPFFARSVQRRDYDPGQVYSNVGFRCAADSDQSQPTVVPAGPALGGPGSGAATQSALAAKGSDGSPSSPTPGELASGTKP